MRLPARPPDWTAHLREPQRILDVQRDPEGMAFIRQANADYWHWDQLRRHPLPKAWDREVIWAAIKWIRTMQPHPFGLCDPRGKPFWVWQPERAQEDLHHIDLGLGGSIDVGQPRLATKDRDRYLLNALMEEAIASSQLEGAATTRKDAKRMLRAERRPRTHAEQMIANNYRTIMMLREQKDEALTIERIIEIQRSMTQGTLENPDDSGRVRTDSDNVRIEDVRDNEVIYVPPAREAVASSTRRVVRVRERGTR